MQLPEAWQRRFLFLGVGGNAGNLVPSANDTDRGLALGKGYTTILTDTGHVGDGTSAKWTRLPDGDWYQDFGSFKICGQRPFPKTLLL